MTTLIGHTADYEGKSTDQKPEEAEVNAKYVELDTLDVYYFDGTEWKLMGGAGA